MDLGKENLHLKFNVGYRSFVNQSLKKELQLFLQMQAGLTHTVGALQYDVMFDYSDEIRDPMLKDLVADMYDKFMQKIKSKLDKRNKKRASYGQLTNPFMVPGWMPNSIST